MRNLLDESSDAQSLDANRLMGSLHVPAAHELPRLLQESNFQIEGTDEQFASFARLESRRRSAGLDGYSFNTEAVNS